MIIFHHNDMDGLASAAIAQLYAKYYMHIDHISLVCVNYELDVAEKFENAIKENQDTDAIIVDYSITEDTKYLLDMLCEKGYDLIWVDHHISSINFVRNHPGIFDYVNSRPDSKIFLSTAFSAAALSYLLFFEIMKKKKEFFNGEYSEKNIRDEIIENKYCIPMWILYVSDYDTFAHKLDPETLYFKYGYDAIGSCFKKIDYLSRLLIWATDVPSQIQEEDDDLVANLLDKGKCIYDYVESQNKVVYNSFGYTAEFKGHKCCIINRIGNSFLFGDDYYKYDLCITWVYNGSDYVYSLYSHDNTIKCNEIAETYGGGGHPGAAGFRLKYLLPELNVNNKNSKKEI